MSQPKESFVKTLPAWRWVKLATKLVTYEYNRHTKGMGGRDVNLKTKSTLLNEDGYRPEEKKHFFVAYRYNPAYLVPK